MPPGNSWRSFICSGIRSPDLNAEGTGFVTILDKNNKVISNIGGSEPVYTNGVLQPMRQTEKIFIHPHDVCVEEITTCM